jgi:hypothetical protein
LLLGALGVPLPLIVVAVVALMVGIGFAVGDTLWTTALQRNVPEHAISRISSYDWFGSIALNPIATRSSVRCRSRSASRRPCSPRARSTSSYA